MFLNIKIIIVQLNALKNLKKNVLKMKGMIIKIMKMKI